MRAASQQVLRRTSRRRLARNGPIAWAFGGYWVGMCALVVTLEARTSPLAGWAAGLLGLALVVRMTRMGVFWDGRELRCVSWLVTRRVPVGDVAAVRAVGYSGFANRFSVSGMLSMLVVERASARPVVLRGAIARAATAIRVAHGIEDVARGAAGDPPRADRSSTRVLLRETRAALAAVGAAFGSPRDAPDADFEAAVEADTLQAAVVGSLSRSGMRTSGVLFGKESCRELLRRTDLRAAQREAVAEMLSVLERW